MSDLALQAAGILAIAVSVIHAVLGETKVFARARIEPARLGLLIHLVWHCSTIAWIAGGVLLLVAAGLPSGPPRTWIVAVLAVVYAAAATGNAWATRGRHVGWMAMAAVVGLSLAGF